MTILSPIDLRDAATIVAVANTPIFLAKRMRELPAAQRARELFTPEQLFGALEQLVLRKPTSHDQVVEPFFYLSVLALHNQGVLLRKASELSAPNLRWFAEVAAYYYAAARPTSLVSVGVPLATPPAAQSASLSPKLILPSSVANSAPRILRATQ